MKGAGDLVFTPEGDEDETAPKDDAEESGSDSLLGNAFDAFQDGDREGFIRSMRAFARSMKD
jgi:hypothetical protein